MKSTKSKQFWRAFLFGMILIHAWGFAVAIQEVIVVDAEIVGGSDTISAMIIADFVKFLVPIAFTIFIFVLSNPLLRRVGVRPFNNMNTQDIPWWKAGAVLLGCVGGMAFFMTVFLLFTVLILSLGLQPLDTDNLITKLFLYSLSLLTLFAILQIKERVQYWRR